MKERLLAAAVGLAVLLPSIIFGGVHAVDLVAFLALSVCAFEFAQMALPEVKVVAALWVFVCSVFLGALAILAPVSSTIGLSLVVVLTLIGVTFWPGEELSSAANRAGRLLLGISWLSLLASLPLLRRLDGGLAWVFLVLTISWLGDTGGYFAGRAFGKHKLYERISPKKTIEGALGGIAFATFGVFVVRAVGLPQLSVLDCLVLGPVLCVSGIVGDLSESMMKRSFGVKDSGTIMPGHGGLLDRIDSVLFVAPLLYSYAAWVVR